MIRPGSLGPAVTPQECLKPVRLPVRPPVRARSTRHSETLRRELVMGRLWKGPASVSVLHSPAQVPRLALPSAMCCGCWPHR